MRTLAICLAMIVLCFCAVGARAQQLRDPVVVGPEQSKCSDILDLEKLNYDPERNVIRLDYLHPQRGATYMAVIGWLQGFFSGRNLFDLSIDGDLTKGTKSLEWMNWMFNYCRQHPASTLFEAGVGLSNSLVRTYKESRQRGRHFPTLNP